jgi:hypothetical protein
MGESAVMDSVARQRVKDALLAQVEAELRASRAKVAGEDSAARLDPDSSYSVDDQSRADEAGDLGGLFEGTEERQAGILRRIDDLDFGPKTEVTPGDHRLRRRSLRRLRRRRVRLRRHHVRRDLAPLADLRDPQGSASG